MGESALPDELIVDAKPGKEFAIVGLFIDGERFLEFAANQAQHTSSSPSARRAPTRTDDRPPR